MSPTTHSSQAQRWAFFATLAQLCTFMLRAVALLCGVIGSGLEYRYLIRIGSGDLLKYPLSQATSKREGTFGFIAPLFKRDTFVFLTWVAALASVVSAALVAFAIGAVGVLISVLMTEARLAKETKGAQRLREKPVTTNHRPCCVLDRSWVYETRCCTVGFERRIDHQQSLRSRHLPRSRPRQYARHRHGRSVRSNCRRRRRQFLQPCRPRGKTCLVKKSRRLRSRWRHDLSGYASQFGLFQLRCGPYEPFNEQLQRIRLSRRRRSPSGGTRGVLVLASPLQQYGLKRDTAPASDAEIDRLRARFYVVLLQAARATADGQLVVGVGLKPTGLSVIDLNPAKGQPSTLFSTYGLGYSVGFLWRPTDAIFRVGASYSTAVKTRSSASSSITPDADGNRVISPGTLDAIYLPERVELPWELNVGFAAQFGARPFNPHWLGPNELLRPTRRRLAWRQLERQRRQRRILAEAKRDGRDLEQVQTLLSRQEQLAQADDEVELERALKQVDDELRERYRKLGRWYILLSTSLSISGPVDDAVGVESFLQRYVDRSGRRTVVSPHFGVESEVISNWLKLRAGAYGEPTRFDNARSAPRLHTTLGLEQKLFNWRVFGLYEDGTAWRIHGAVDLSERYFGFSGSVGVWH